jgi:hypothetical protein
VGKRKERAAAVSHRETFPRKADSVGPGQVSHHREHLVLAVCFLYAVFLSVFGIANHAFWDDEANTALFGRNLLASGELTAFDGVNVAGYREGAELDENLHNTYMPSLQYYVTAGAFALLGQGTFAGRIPFVVAGLLAIVAVALWVRWHLAGRIPVWLPFFIASVMPAWLLYMRQCRYYALGALFTFVLLAAWARVGSSRREDVLATLAGGTATAALWWTSYLNAASAMVMLPLFYALPAYRRPEKHRFLAVVYAVTIACGMYVYLVKNPYAAAVAEPDALPGLERYAVLAWRHLRDFGTMEFFPVCLLPVLALPYLAGRWRELRPLAREGIVLCGAMLAASAVIVAFTPQPVTITRYADMRYAVPLILVGAAVTSICIIILWKAAWPIGAVAAALVVFTNLLTLSWAIVPHVPLRSTLAAYMIDISTNYRTGNEAVIETVKALPKGSTVLILPPFMAYSAMFYAHEYRYVDQLPDSKPLRPELRAKIPGHVFNQHARPDFVLTAYEPKEVIGQLEDHFDGETWRLVRILKDDWADGTRPEITLHSFGPPPPHPLSHGMALIEANAH